MLKNATIRVNRSEQHKKPVYAPCLSPGSQRAQQTHAQPGSRKAGRGPSYLPTGLSILILHVVNWDSRRRWAATVGRCEPGLELAAPCGPLARLIASDLGGGQLLGSIISITCHLPGALV